jgi:hypothetical protein
MKSAPFSAGGNRYFDPGKWLVGGRLQHLLEQQKFD